MDIYRLFYFLVIIPSAIIHEYSHGLVADRLGDPTARYAGRLTLDPRVHVDLWGTLLLPFLLFLGSGGTFMFAYAKPVPINPFNLRNQKWGPALVSAAGPLSNLLLACAFALTLRIVPHTSATPFFSAIISANVLLAIFNLLPIPPLDGSKILYGLVDVPFQTQVFLDRYGFVILLVFLFFGAPLLGTIVGLITQFLVPGW